MSKYKTTDNSHPQSFWSKFIQKSFHILFFTTPLLLWPYTSEVFEFNKMIFVYFMTVVIFSAWMFDSLKKQKFTISKTPLDIPLFLFLLSQIASTVFSIDRHTSLWGYYSRFHGGLISTISYIVLFYAFVTFFQNNTKAIYSVVKTLLISATITSFYGVLEHFGIDKHIWVQDVQNRVFSTLGQPNWLSAYLIALLPIPLYFAFNYKNKTHYSYLFLSVLFLTTIIYTKSQSGIVATGIVLLLFTIKHLKSTNKKYILLMLLPIFLLGVYYKRNAVFKTLQSLNYINPLYSNSLQIAKAENETRIGGSDSMIIRRIVWDGAIKLGLSRPIFGTGLETFGYTYYWVRPLAHNFTSETDFLYNKAHNEYLNFLANSGFVGLISYLFLIYSIIKILKNKTEMSEPLLLGFISILITNFIGFSVVNVALFFFLYPAFVLSMSPRESRSILLPDQSFFGYSVIILLTFLGLIKVKNIWLADIYYNKGKASVEANEMAIKLNPNEPLYQSQLGYIQSLITSQIMYPQMASMATAEASIKQKAQTIFNNYIQNSTDNANLAVQKNPYNLNLLKNKTRVELALANIDPKYNQQAEQTLLQIIKLSPTDPANYYNLGIFYNSIDKTEEAKLYFDKALELYPKYNKATEQLQKIQKKTSN